MRRWSLSTVVLLLVLGPMTPGLPRADAADIPRWSDHLRGLPTDVLTDAQRASARTMVERDIRRRADRVNRRCLAEWREIHNAQDWEQYRDERIDRLLAALGSFPSTDHPLDVRVTGSLDGSGFTIEKLLYESRTGDWVPGNLYVPNPLRPSMPGILIAHSHHRPKTQGELQDMGMTWARAGCLVLVIDQVGHGERRGHSFVGPEDYGKSYRPSTQDYYFRYDSGIQLHLVGDSLMGWMAWDLMRGVDLLLAQPNVDPNRILLLGAVAGGGDPCAVAAALDDRIAAAVPFNFGGPQPESPFPLPDDAETSFDYMGRGSWESTRGLRRSGADGFLHWLIVGSIAPRHLVYAHEFSWDRERDPVWNRFERIYGDFYGAAGALAFTHGRGLLRDRPPGATHCTNIGPVHRLAIHEAFRQWFGIEVTSDSEYSARRDPDELMCRTRDLGDNAQPKSFVHLVSDLGRQRAESARRRWSGMTLSQRRGTIRDNWSRLLGSVDVASPPVVVSHWTDDAALAGVTVERVAIQVEPEIVVPLLILRPSDAAAVPRPPVVAVSQAGKEAFLRHHPGDLAELVAGGLVVCLPDVRGTGETRSDRERGRESDDTHRSADLLMIGETMLGQRLRDLRSVLVYLRGRDDVDSKHLFVWGDSFAPPLSSRTDIQVPRGVDGQPAPSEPLGGLLALLTGLYEDTVRAVSIRRPLASYQTVLMQPRVGIPHDVVVPGVLMCGDLCDVAAALAPLPLRIEEPIDGLNRRLPIERTRQQYGPAREAYDRAGAPGRLSIADKTSCPAEWFLRHETDTHGNGSTNNAP